MPTAPNVPSMLNKFLLVIMLGLFMGLAPSWAQNTPATPARIKGHIIAAKVVGHVEALSKVDGTSRVLKDNDQLTDKMQIITSPWASVVLAFSNGASVNLSAGSTLDIEEFEQDPFGEDIKFSNLKPEQGTSVTKLNLTRGQLVGKVVHLNVDKGSEFTVQTPVGAAGIRGTTFMITFTPGPNNTAFFSVTTADGTVVFSSPNAIPVSVPTGKSVVATFTYTPPVAATATSPAIPATITPVTLVTQDAPAAVVQQVMAISQAIVVTTEAVVISSQNGTAPPTSLIGTEASVPVVVPPQTTSQAGGPH